MSEQFYHNSLMVPFLFKTSFFILFLSFILLGILPAYAVQINQVYSARIPVASQQKPDRGVGFDQAFKMVLIKASGQFDKVSQPAFMAAMLPAEPFVQTFSYRENPAYQEYLQQQSSLEAPGVGLEGPINADVQIVDATSESEPESTSTSEIPDTEELVPLPYLLDVSFAQSIVEEKMAAQGVPVWGSVRPSVLVWLVRENEGERSLVGTSDSGEFVEPLMALGEQRGVPLYFPVADLQDVSSVDVDDIWGLFPESVALASERYQADAVVMMRVYRSENGLWSGNWSLNLKGSLDVGSRYDSESTDLLASFVSEIADTLSSRYAVFKVPGEEGSVLELEVSQINTFADYVEIQRYLTELPPVSSMSMKWVRNGRAAYQVKLIGSKDQFFEHIDLGGRLKKGLAAANTQNTDQVIIDFEQPNQEDQKVVLDVLDVLSAPIEYYVWSSSNSLLTPKR